MRPSLLYSTTRLNHHQYPLAVELARRFGADRFRFAVVKPMGEERTALGWSEDADAPAWVLRVYEGGTGEAEYKQWLSSADCVVSGIPDGLADRAGSGALTCYMSERWWKPALMQAHRWHPQALLRRLFGRYSGTLRLLSPRFALRTLSLVRRSRIPTFHLLAIGRYAADDLALLGAFPGRMWRWGYFTQVPADPPAVRTNNPVSILWAGRMLPLKRVDVLIRALKGLDESGIAFEATLVGDGPAREELVALATRLGLGGCITFVPPVSAGDVVTMMRQSDIYVFPSSASEGWGAVVGEAMAHGCVVAACREAGASAVLIEHGESGFLFDEGDADELMHGLAAVIQDAALRRNVGYAAWRVMQSMWSPQVAAERLHAWVGAALAGTPPDNPRGPCSRITHPFREDAGPS